MTNKLQAAAEFNKGTEGTSMNAFEQSIWTTAYTLQHLHYCLYGLHCKHTYITASKNALLFVHYIWIWKQQDWEVDQEIDGKIKWERNERCSENAKESSHSAHANGMNEWLHLYITDCFNAHHTTHTIYTHMAACRAAQCALVCPQPSHYTTDPLYMEAISCMQILTVPLMCRVPLHLISEENIWNKN
jgi:hypothetical protein